MLLKELIMFEFVKSIFQGSPNKNPLRDSSKTGSSSSGDSSKMNVKTEKTWICKKCSQENLLTSSFCKSCGEYK
jgi:hypothetical protein